MKIINNVLKVLSFPLKIVCYLLIYMYKKLISPVLPKQCAYYPSCSSYMLESIKEWGVIRGIALGVKRICRCHPKCKGGVDYVPLNIEGDNRWIF